MADGIRLNKYLSDHGILSRRKADEEIAAGRVFINGEPAVMGQRVFEGDEVTYKNAVIDKKDEAVLIAVNKPAGIVCTAEKRERDNIVDFIAYPVRIYPIGRLDKDSHGLILMTNQGDLVNKIMKASNYHEKEYIVRVNKPITAEFLHGMSQPVPIRELKTSTRPCKVKQISKFTFSIVLTQGLNRQIRRMCEFFDYRVRDLKRVRIMNINLGELPEGQYRNLTNEEKETLEKLLLDSTNNGRKRNGTGNDSKRENRTALPKNRKTR